MTETPVGAWIRVSSTLQDEANQVPDIERYCAERGYKIIKRYELNDRSAFKGEQEAKQQEALADVRSGKVKVVVAWASDRVERRGAEATLRIFREVKDAGGRLESVLEPFLSSDDAELMQAITGWKDRQESKRKGERVSIARDRIRTNDALWGSAPYGYKVSGDKYGKTLVPDPDQKAVILEAVDRYLAGESLQDICKDFDARGIPIPRPRKGKANRWHPSTLSRVLTNPTITGRKKDASGRTVLRCEQIVTIAKQQQVIDRMSRRAHGKGVMHTKEKALLSSVIRCAGCGRRMYPLRVTAERVYYYCRSGNDCDTLLPMEYADGYVSDWITSHESYEITETRVTPGKNYDDEIDHVRQDIRELDPEADDYDCQLAALRAELARLRGLPSVPDRTETVLTGRKASDEWPQWGTAERRRFLIDNGFTVVVHGAKSLSERHIDVRPGYAYAEKVFGEGILREFYERWGQAKEEAPPGESGGASALHAGKPIRGVGSRSLSVCPFNHLIYHSTELLAHFIGPLACLIL